jgi:threonine aldolase
MNAVVASGVSAAEYAGGFDTAWLDFTKGLGAPVGAVLCGSRELITEAWRWKQQMGGAFRQSGIVAAGCLYALDHNVDRLADDHARARRLAEGLAEAGISVDLYTVETNFVGIPVPAGMDVPEARARIRDEGVLVSGMRPGVLRAATYLGIEDEHIDHALDAIPRALGALVGA